MDKKNETFIELTPEQMAGVTGGASRTADYECPKGPDGRHEWKKQSDCILHCVYCHKETKRRYEIY